MPFIVFCLSGISAGGLSLLLPETLNKPGAETLDELSSPVYQRILEMQVNTPPPSTRQPYPSPALTHLWAALCSAGTLV